MSITFVDQENRVKMETTTAEGGNDSILNPITKAATIVWRLRTTPETTNHIQLHAFHQDGKSSKITQTEKINQLRLTAHAIEEERLGFHLREIRNRSMRTSTAMG